MQQQLSSLDAEFLYVESATTVGHVGALLMLDPASAPGGQLSLDRVREVLEPRLHLAPQLRQRLVRVPLGLGLPYWIDDPDFDIEFHLRDIGLPGLGSGEQLAEQVARIHARPLDRTRPLWEMYLIHNVSGGHQALYSKIHHAAIDGVSGAEILATILDTTVEPRVVEPPDEYWAPEPLPSQLTLLQRGVAAAAAQPRDALRILPRTLPHLADLPGASLIPGAQLVSDLADGLVKLATDGAQGRTAAHRTVATPATPLNKAITPHRRFAYGSLPLSEIKTVKNAMSMTVNDVVMALCTSTLRRWLLDHDGLPDTPIVIAVPVSVRSDAGGGPPSAEAAGAEPEAGVAASSGEGLETSSGAHLVSSAGNQVSVMLAEMPTHIADPLERLEAVRLAMAEAKEHFDALPATVLQDIVSVVPTALAGLATRAAFAMVTAAGFPFNLFISNVPGPQEPLYVGGAKVLGIYPASAITDATGALNITLFSYDGALDFGLIACREIVPDVQNLIGYLRNALDELLAVTTGKHVADRPEDHPAVPD